MTAEEWEKAEQNLNPLLGHVDFLIDGYKVSVAMIRTSKTKYSYMVYVDGVFEGKWLTEDCEIRRRFYYEGKRTLFTPKKKAELIKECGKRHTERFIKEHPELCYVTFHRPYFGSFKSLKQHFIKNNTSITLVE